VSQHTCCQRDLLQQIATYRAENDRLRVEKPDWWALIAENERLRAALDLVGPRLEAHHRAMAAGDLMPCSVCGADDDDGAE